MNLHSLHPCSRQLNHASEEECSDLSGECVDVCVCESVQVCMDVCVEVCESVQVSACSCVCV